MSGGGDIGGGSTYLDFHLDSGPEWTVTDPDVNVTKGVVKITINVASSLGAAPKKIVVPLAKRRDCVHLEWKNSAKLRKKARGRH